jgi:ferredoxin
MCEFCHKHGEGKKWYLQAKNYSDDLLSDLRRRKFIEDFFKEPMRLKDDLEKLDKLDKAPELVRRAISWFIVKNFKKNHYGQVVPIEEIEHILGFATSVVRVACICRHVTVGAEKRYCYGMTLGPGKGKMAEILEGIEGCFLNAPGYKGVEELSKEQAIANMKKYERQGLCHTVWTFRAPFIGGICNCDRADCGAMKTTVTHGVPIMFRAEYVAEMDPDLCNGCRLCMRVCQFGAITYSASNKKTYVDPRRCYGCGICRAVCKPDAIRLLDRAQVPIAANLW